MALHGYAWMTQILWWIYLYDIQSVISSTCAYFPCEFMHISLTTKTINFCGFHTWTLQALKCSRIFYANIRRISGWKQIYYPMTSVKITALWPRGFWAPTVASGIHAISQRVMVLAVILQICHELCHGFWKNAPLELKHLFEYLQSQLLNCFHVLHSNSWEQTPIRSLNLGQWPLAIISS